MSAPFSGHLYIRMNDYGKFQGVYKMLLGNFSSIASVKIIVLRVLQGDNLVV
jgi:hypothetical protein